MKNMKHKISNQIYYQVDNQDWSQFLIHDRLIASNQVRNQISTQILNQVYNQMRDNIK